MNANNIVLQFNQLFLFVQTEPFYSFIFKNFYWYILYFKVCNILNVLYISIEVNKLTIFGCFVDIHFIEQYFYQHY